MSAGLHVCDHMHALCLNAKEAMSYSETRIPDGCDVGALNLCPLQQQQVFLATDPPVQLNRQ